MGCSTTAKCLSTAITAKKSSSVCPSTNQFTTEKSSGTDGFRGGSNKSGTTSESPAFHPSSSYLRGGTGSGAPNCSGNSRSSSSTTTGVSRDGGSGNVAKKSAAAEPSSTFSNPSYYNPNAGTRATTELKSSTGGGAVTYGAIGSSAIASLRTTPAPRYGLKTNGNLKLQSAYTSSYAGSCASLTSGSNLKDRADDFSKPNPQTSNKPKENKGSPLRLMCRGTSPLKDDPELPDSTSKSSKISEHKEMEAEQECSTSASISNRSANVLHKEVQTEKAIGQMHDSMKGSKQCISSIPRPFTTSYSPFASALTRFTTGVDVPGTIKPSPMNPNPMSDAMIKTMTGTNESSSESESSSSSSSIKSKTPGSDTGKMKKGWKDMEAKAISPSSPSDSTNCNKTNSPIKRDYGLEQQRQNSSRPPADPNKLSSSSSSRSPSSSKSTIPTLTLLASPPFKSKFSRNSSPSNRALKQSSCSPIDVRNEDLSNCKGRRGSGTSTSSTSSRSSSSERPPASVVLPSSKTRTDMKQGSPQAPSAPSYQKTSHGEKHAWIKRSPEPGPSPWWMSKGSSPPSDNASNVKTVLRNPNWDGSQRESDKTETEITTHDEPSSKMQGFPSNGKCRGNTEVGNIRGSQIRNRSGTQQQPLEDRTSPDGTEIPSPQLSTPVDHVSRMGLTEEKPRQLFISSDMTNIDDILGVSAASPSLLTAEIPSTKVPPPKFSEPLRRFDSLLSDDEDSSEDGEAAAGVGEEEQASSSDSDPEDDDGGASSDSCSSFEEVDLSSVGINNFPRDPDRPNPMR